MRRSDLFYDRTVHAELQMGLPLQLMLNVLLLLCQGTIQITRAIKKKGKRENVFASKEINLYNVNNNCSKIIKNTTDTTKKTCLNLVSLSLTVPVSVLECSPECVT